MTSKIKKVIFGLLAIFAILIIIAFLTAPKEAGNDLSTGNAPEGENAAPAGTALEPPSAPTFQTSEKRFELVEARTDGTYRVYDIDEKKDVDLFIPEDANITAGSRADLGLGAFLSVQRYMLVGSSFIAAELSITAAQ